MKLERIKNEQLELGNIVYSEYTEQYYIVSSLPRIIKEGNEQLKNMKSAWDFIDEYYNNLTWYQKIITKIKWSFDDFCGFFIRLYYKIIIKILYKKEG